MSTSAGDNAIGQAPQLASASAELAPMTRPMSPPVRQSVTASIKNCERMSRRRARRPDGGVPALHVTEFVVAYSSSKVMRTRTSTVAVPASMGTDLADISMGAGDA